MSRKVLLLGMFVVFLAACGSAGSSEIISEKYVIKRATTPLVDLYESADAMTPVREIPKAEFPTGIEVDEVSPNGRFLVTIGEEKLWILPSQVRTDRKHYLSANCGVVVQDHSEVAARRGLGEGCKK